MGLTNMEITRMTKEEIIELVMQIGGCDRPEDDSPALKMFVTFAKLVADKEREACAKVCDDRAFRFFSESPFFVEMHGLADAIRARGNHD